MHGKQFGKQTFIDRYSDFNNQSFMTKTENRLIDAKGDVVKKKVVNYKDRFFDHAENTSYSNLGNICSNMPR